MSNKASKVVVNSFKGSIDELLNHVNTLDVDAIAAEAAKTRQYQAQVTQVMREQDLSRKDAEELLDRGNIEELDSALDELIASGVIEIVSYDAAGEPLYGAVEPGKQQNIKQ